MPKVLISDSIDKIAAKILESNNIHVDTITDLSSEKLKEIISNYDGLIYTKYFQGSGLSKFQKLSEIGTKPKMNKIWKYNFIFSKIYLLLKKIKFKIFKA